MIDPVGREGGAQEIAVRWTVRGGEPGPAPSRYDAFFGQVRLAIQKGSSRVWSPSAELEITANEVCGVASGPCALPAAIALHVLAAYAGLAHLHAAVVRVAGTVLIAPGGSGSGKTSLALSVGELLTDDQSYLDDALTVWPVRRPPHAAQATARAHRDLEILGPVIEGALPKVRLAARERGPAAPARIDAIVVPTIDAGARTRIEPIEAAAVFPVLIGASALAPIERSPHRERILDRLARLAELPASRLIAGPDALEEPDRIARAIEEWIRRG